MAVSVIDQTGLLNPITLTTPNLGTPSAINLSNATALARAAMPTGCILQVQQTVLQGTFSTTSTSYTNVTGLAVSITPFSASSKIYIQAVLTCTNTGQNGTYMLVTRNGSTMAGSLSSSGTLNGTGAAIQSSAGFIDQSGTTYTVVPLNLNYIDSPATTSALTYQVQTRTGSTATALINYQGTNTTQNNNADFGYYVSTITVMEIAG
jgi:hypothetical protein